MQNKTDIEIIKQKKLKIKKKFKCSSCHKDIVFMAEGNYESVTLICNCGETKKLKKKKVDELA